jgi:hypothetical protein
VFPEAIICFLESRFDLLKVVDRYFQMVCQRFGTRRWTRINIQLLRGLKWLAITI